jgi:uncharacterized FAD-dependent dehydrogenase
MIDAGYPMTKRWCPETQACSCRSCYVLEGEGGAGGFSDGKLPYSLLRGTQMETIFDPSAESILWEIDEEVVRYGGEGVWYDPKDATPPDWSAHGLEFTTYPLRHVGSDGVRDFASGITRYLVNRGVNVVFNMKAERLAVNQSGRITDVIAKPRGQARDRDEIDIKAETVVLATGIQGLDWSSNALREVGVELHPGPAGIGIRVEAPADTLEPMFETFYDWKVIMQWEGLTYRSFCCNRRGYVVNQWHQDMGIRNVNGHSFLDPERRSQYSNFAVIAKVDEQYNADPQHYTQTVAREVNSLSHGHTGLQRVTAFLERENTKGRWPHTNVMARYVDITAGLPTHLWMGYCKFLMNLAEASTFDLDRSWVYAPEIKYPAARVPVEFNTWRSKDIDHLYVLGDATGYLDSFITAAVTGVQAARDIVGRTD